MTWIDNFIENAKSPAIGTPAWFNCIPENGVGAARQLVNDMVPVFVETTTPGTVKVVFADTEFTAGTFCELQAATEYAAAWNAKARGQSFAR